MDLSVLPNNNNPEKFLQLNVKCLPVSSSLMQAGFATGAALSGQRYWQNRVYLQRKTTDTYGRRSTEASPELVDRALGKHITAVTLKSKIKKNPLYSDIRTVDGWENRKTQPSWTIQEYNRQSVHSNLADYQKEDPNELGFWMEDLYTPGYDTLLKNKETEQKRTKICKIITLVSVLSCALIVIITVSVVITRH
ncbi:major intrinsically disordered NOTCH2-binding receptor 1-like [Acipenser oxyrinchus oxyrinchus]|uniref:Major intrinsically disordered NOTCH2-binding receptor 1-like n=1 Tax=Acipenser oxyrinchus oxyrinchus TaxID=40147 RepID=A0AAD8GLC2_ACIOX|nr:major intrinsically disordered NOTCH2-binding receptor 1-like [Acipenser oxyrinchus oxyrinchus]